VASSISTPAVASTSAPVAAAAGTGSSAAPRSCALDAASPGAASTVAGSAKKEDHQLWLDPEEFTLRKRLPPSFPKRNIDIYITNKTHPKAQFERCQQLIQSGESVVYLHALGAAIPRALNLALKLQKFYGEQVTLETTTSTVELTDDFERVSNNAENAGGGGANTRTRPNSGIYVKISHKPRAAATGEEEQ